MVEELNDIALGFKNNFLAFLPKMIIALAVLGVGYLLARLVKYLAVKLVNYIGRLLSRRFKQMNLEQAASFLGSAFFWLILFSTFLLITDILGLPVITRGMESILAYTPNILAAILILFAANVLGKLISELLSSVSIRAGFPYGNTLGRIAQSLILFTAAIIVIDQVGIEITFLINLLSITVAAVLFGAALAFGLGARASVSNILAAFYVRRLFKEGDYVKIGEIEGRITKIDATVVLLDTETGQFIIPAKEFNETKSLLVKKPK